jgi:hypothetical protein
MRRVVETVCARHTFSFGDDSVCMIQAPAGGAAAAAPEGGALACPSASPHLPVVGVGNPVAVPGLAR